MLKYTYPLIPDTFRLNLKKSKRLKKYDPILGNIVQCNICNNSYKEFAPYGKTDRKAQCLNCGSLERHRLIWYYTQEKKLFSAEKKLKMLHFAPEEAFYRHFIHEKNIEYFPVDLFPEDYFAKVKKVDITKIPHQEGTFDIIFCNHVLEHIPDDHLAMSELFRVMKSGGWGIFQVPIDYNLEKTYEDFNITSPEERLKAFGQKDHVRWYGRDYKNRLESVGFEVIEDDFVLHLPKEIIEKHAFSPNEFIYFVKKR